MDVNTETAIFSYINMFGLGEHIDSVKVLFKADILFELVKVLCTDHVEDPNFEINSNSSEGNSVIDGFNLILKTIQRYFLNEHKLDCNFSDLGVDHYDIACAKDEQQLKIVLYLLIGIIIKEQNDTYINYMMELSEQECETMQTICQDAIAIMDNFTEINKLVSKHPFNDSPDFNKKNSLLDSQNLDKIHELNLQIEVLSNEKRTMRIEISEEK